jgi:hypothetical protein
MTPVPGVTAGFGDRENLRVAGDRPRFVAEHSVGQRERDKGPQLQMEVALGAERAESLFEARDGGDRGCTVPRLRRRT